MWTPALRVFALAAAVGGLAAAPAAAALFNTFSDRASFDAAADPDLFEDFNSAAQQVFAFNTSYLFNGFTITVLPRTDGTFGFVEAGITDTARSDIDGTARLVWGQDSWDGLQNGPDIVFTFNSALTAFGFDWRNTDPSDSYKVVVGTVEFGAISGQEPWPDRVSQGFFGIVSETPFTQLTLVHNDIGGILNDMSMDNIAMTRFDPPPPAPPPGVIPIPPALPLLGAGLVVLFGLGRRRRG